MFPPMIRNVLTGLALALALAACNQKDEAVLTDPFAALTPWDAARDGTVTTESGLQYHVVKKAPRGAEGPGINDQVEVHYEGRLAADGTKFDSSYDRGSPAEFGVTQVIPGWTEALQLMKPGDDWMLYIPSELAYGANPRPGGAIPPDADLIFRVEMLDVIEDPTPGGEYWAAHTPWNTDGGEVEVTASGVQFVRLASGPEGGTPPGPDSQVIAHYDGRLADSGRRFDSSYARGEPAMFGVSRVIPGWTEALQLMRPGDDWLVYIPSALGYGPRGTPGGPIPPDANLIFRIDLQASIDPAASDAAAWERLVPWPGGTDGIMRTASGLEYAVIESGPAEGAMPTRDNSVVVFYEGRLAATGETFDSAYARGEPITFGVTQVIPGWTEALQLMRPGDHWMIYLPAELAYGAAGRPGIPPDADLIFEVELAAVL